MSTTSRPQLAYLGTALEELKQQHRYFHLRVLAGEQRPVATFDGKKVKVLGPTFEEGKPETPINWRQKMRSREEMLGYLKTGERYWFSEEWFGSEKRKTKA